MKIVVDTYAWAQKADLSSSQLEGLRTALTITPRKVGDHPGEAPGPISLFSENAAVFGMPRQFFLGRRKPAHEVEFRTTEGDKTNWPGDLKFVGTLREEQARGRVHVVGMLRGGALGGIVRAVPGWGKTVWTCAVMAELQVPTLVVVHKEFLMDQWRQRIQEYLPAAKIGIAQGPDLDFKGRHVVLGMVHSLCEKDYGEEFRKYFGLVVTDESIPGRSRVLTEHGYRTVESIVGSDSPIRVVAYDQSNHRFVLRAVTRRWVHPPRNRMLKVTHERGSFECTSEHVVITPSGDIRARDLVAGVDSVIHYGYEHPKLSVQSSARTGGGFNNGGWASSSSVAFRQDVLPSKALSRSEGLGVDEVRTTSRVVRHRRAGGAQQGVGQIHLDVQHFESRGSGCAASEDVSRRKETSESEVAGGVLVLPHDGLVGDGRRKRRLGTKSSASHGEFHAPRGRTLGEMVCEERVPGFGDKISLVQGSALLGSGFKEDGAVHNGSRYSSASLQGGSLFYSTETDLVRLMQQEDSALLWEVRQPQILYFSDVSESRASRRLWVPQSVSPRDLQAAPDTQMRSLQVGTTGERTNYAEDLFRTLQAGEENLDGAGVLLRETEGVLAGNPVPSRVLSVTEVETPELVYDLSVGEHHNFVVEGVVIHNCHRIGSETWSRVPPLFPAKWRLGLSATPRRKDGADAVFHHHIGEVIFASKEVRMKPKVRKVWITPDLFKVVHTPNFNPSLIKKGLLLRFMCVSAGRNRVITEQIIQAVKAGRKCLVLSERLQHLRDLEILLYKQWGEGGDKPSVGFYIGGQEQEALNEAAKAQVIFATSQLVQEGLDIPPLDTIFLTCPMGDVEQAIGRVLRPFEGKKEPIVVDFRDDHIGLCKRYGEFRDKFYKKQEWAP